jgi:hypothetical protein
MPSKLIIQMLRKFSFFCSLPCGILSAQTIFKNIKSHTRFSRVSALVRYKLHILTVNNVIYVGFLLSRPSVLVFLSNLYHSFGHFDSHQVQHSDHVGTLIRLLLLLQIGSLTYPGHLYLCVTRHMINPSFFGFVPVVFLFRSPFLSLFPPFLPLVCTYFFKSSSSFSYSGFRGGLEHLKIETRLIDERFESEMGECVIQKL